MDADLAFPCATQNELDSDDAEQLVNNKCQAIFEGANMPCTAEAIQHLEKAGVIIGPSKAANAGGVAVSGMEISQNQSCLPWQAGRVDDELQAVMKNIHSVCRKYGKTKKTINYRKGANIAAFIELSKALTLYGVY